MPVAPGEPEQIGASGAWSLMSSSHYFFLVLASSSQNLQRLGTANNTFVSRVGQSALADYLSAN